MWSEDVEARLGLVRERIGRAAERVGRDPESVEILPVTKGHPAAGIEIVRSLGLRAIGENRVSEAEGKRAELGGTPDLRWHMIGRLQRNKARRAVRTFDVIESVDSLRLAETLGRIVLEEPGGAPLDVLVQVNTSGEEVKAGLRAEEAARAVAEICRVEGLRVDGLMTMAPYTDDEGVLRRTFRGARELLERCRDEVSGFAGTTLSMGMSNDFELAVEEGSTRLRLGTVILGAR